MKLVSALCEDNKKKSLICLQVTFSTKLQNWSFQVVNWRKRGRKMHLIEKMHLQSVQNCSLSWKLHQVCHLCTRISRNTGISGRLRHCTSLSQLQQPYYNIIYPYVSYAITSWGSVFATQIKTEIQAKQIMLFVLCSLPPCMDQIQTVHYHYLTYWIYLLVSKNIYKLRLLKFTHQIAKYL